MSSETKGDHDSLHVSDVIESMRQCLERGDEAQAYALLHQDLFPRSSRWVRNGRRISWHAAQDVVSQAVDSILPDLFSPTVSPEEASRRLKTALNTARAEHVRRAAREQSFGDFEPLQAALRLYEEVDPLEQIDQEAEQAHREQRLMEILSKLRALMEISLERLSPSKYAILHEIYDLGEVGMAKPVAPSPLSDLKPVARRVAVHRARRQFLDELDQILREACQSLKDEAAILEGVTKLIEGGHLADALALQQTAFKLTGG